MMINVSKARMNTLGGRAEIVKEILDGECLILQRLMDDKGYGDMKEIMSGEEKALLFAIQMLKAVLNNDREEISKHADLTNRLLSRI